MSGHAINGRRRDKREMQRGPAPANDHFPVTEASESAGTAFLVRVTFTGVARELIVEHERDMFLAEDGRLAGLELAARFGSPEAAEHALRTSPVGTGEAVAVLSVVQLCLKAAIATTV